MPGQFLTITRYKRNRVSVVEQGDDVGHMLGLQRKFLRDLL